MLLGPCQECGKMFETPKWATSRRDRERCRFCSKTCSNRNTARNRASTKGWIRDPKGYILVRAPQHPMASREGYVMQHRLVAAEMLGRMLKPNEVVHHLNGVKDDNRPENLEVMEKAEHDRKQKHRGWHTTMCPHCGGLIQARSRVRAAVPGTFVKDES